MKKVGIILREWRADLNNMLFYGVKTDLIGFLRKYDVSVIAIPIDFSKENEFEKVKEIVDYCDGIIFPGGKYVRKIDMEIMKYLYDINIRFGMVQITSTSCHIKKMFIPFFFCIMRLNIVIVCNSIFILCSYILSFFTQNHIIFWGYF